MDTTIPTCSPEVTAVTVFAVGPDDISVCPVPSYVPKVVVHLGPVTIHFDGPADAAAVGERIVELAAEVARIAAADEFARLVAVADAEAVDA